MKIPRPVEVIRLDRPMAGGALKAFADVRVGQLVFRNVRLIDDPVGGFCVAGPQVVRETMQGRRHTTLVSWPRRWRVVILECVLAAYVAQEGARS